MKREFIHDPYLVLYLPLWKRDAANGQSFMSDDAYGHLATVTGATWGIQGRTFDGTDDKIVVPSSANYNIASQGTVELWIKPTTLATGDIFCGRYKDGVNKGWFFRTDIATAAVIEFSPDDTLLIESTSSVLVVNTWSYIVMTFDSAGVYNLYHNAVNVKTTASGQTAPLEGTNDLWIGGIEVAALYFPGIIGEVRICNRALTAVEIQNNYLTTKWRFK